MTKMVSDISKAVSVLENAPAENIQEKLDAISALKESRIDAHAGLLFKIVLGPNSRSNESAMVIQESARVLGGIGTKESDRFSKQVLNSDSARLPAQAGILEAMHERVRLGDKAAEQIFFKAAKSSSSDIRGTVVKLSLQLPSGISEPILRDALTDLPEIAASALDTISERLIFRNSKIQENLIDIALGKTSAPSDLRISVINVLDKIKKQPEVNRALGELLLSHDRDIKNAAERVLAAS